MATRHWKKWYAENGALVAVLAIVTWRVGLTWETFLLSVSVIGSHTGISHGIRLREEAGKQPVDWHLAVSAWVTAASAIATLHGNPRVYGLTALIWQALFYTYRVYYRRLNPVEPTQWGL